MSEEIFETFIPGIMSRNNLNKECFLALLHM